MNSAFEVIIFVIQVMSGIVLLYVLYRLYRFYRSYKFDKRFGSFAIEVFEEENDSLFDNISDCFVTFRDKVSKFLMKSKVLTDYSKKYEKYSEKAKVTSFELMNYISN